MEYKTLPLTKQGVPDLNHLGPKQSRNQRSKDPPAAGTVTCPDKWHLGLSSRGPDDMWCPTCRATR